MPEGAIYVGRPTRWGNPFPLGVIPIEDVLESYRTWATLRVFEQPDFLMPLRDKDLACFCKENAPCHADVLLELANQ